MNFTQVIDVIGMSEGYEADRAAMLGVLLSVISLSLTCNVGLLWAYRKRTMTTSPCPQCEARSAREQKLERILAM
jgi:hypothetical protein